MRIGAVPLSLHPWPHSPLQRLHGKPSSQQGLHVVLVVLQHMGAVLHHLGEGRELLVARRAVVEDGQGQLARLVLACVVRLCVLLDGPGEVGGLEEVVVNNNTNDQK